jgi:hypothetical protein
LSFFEGEKFFKLTCGETVEGEKRTFHFPQPVEGCGGNVKESVENFSAKKREGTPASGPYII